MYSFRKSKKGFTLIELMVVVAIIGVLALLGLRLYTGQQAKAKEAIVRANAGTIQTLIQAELADNPDTIILTGAGNLFAKSGIHNPYTGDPQTDNGDTGTRGLVIASDGTALANTTDESGVYFVNGYDDDSVTGTASYVYTNDLTARR